MMMMRNSTRTILATLSFAALSMTAAGPAGAQSPERGWPCFAVGARGEIPEWVALALP